MRLEVTIPDDQLTRWENQVAAIGDGRARVAFSRAINRTTRSVRGQVVREVVKATSIPSVIVRRAVYMSLSSQQGSGPLQGVIYASGYPVPLKFFSARQFSFGVRAKIWGEYKRFEGLFIFAGNFNSGKPVANFHVFQRVTASRLPIEKQDGPAVADGLIASSVVNAWEQRVNTMLPERVSHELGRMLGR